MGVGKEALDKIHEYLTELVSSICEAKSSHFYLQNTFVIPESFRPIFNTILKNTK